MGEERITIVPALKITDAIVVTIPGQDNLSINCEGDRGVSWVKCRRKKVVRAESGFELSLSAWCDPNNKKIGVAPPIFLIVLIYFYQYDILFR